MDKGDCFLMGAPSGRTKHLWVVISDTRKYSGCGVIVNFSTNESRSGGECSLLQGEHPWFTQGQSWVCFKDALLMTVQGWNDIQTGMSMGFIVLSDKMPVACVDKIITAAKTSKFFQVALLKYLD
jgi:hypothetical protein